MMTVVMPENDWAAIEFKRSDEKAGKKRISYLNGNPGWLLPGSSMVESSFFLSQLDMYFFFNPLVLP